MLSAELASIRTTNAPAAAASGSARIRAASASAPLERSAAQDAFSGVRNAKATLLAGFTSVRDVGTYRAYVDVALRDAINDGTVLGPRMQVAGAYVTVSSGGGEVTGLAPDWPS